VSFKKENAHYVVESALHYSRKKATRTLLPPQQQEEKEINNDQAGSLSFVCLNRPSVRSVYALVSFATSSLASMQW
jgi:hypothetical protein